MVTIDGYVVDSDLGEIRRVRRSTKGPILLNLRGLTSCTGGGVQLLRAWLSAGARLQDATPFLEMLLRDSSRSLPTTDPSAPIL